MTIIAILWIASSALFPFAASSRGRSFGPAMMTAGLLGPLAWLTLPRKAKP